MKKTKLLTSIAALGLVLTLGGCNTDSENYPYSGKTDILQETLNRTYESSYLDSTSSSCNHVWGNAYTISSVDSRYHTRTCTLCGEILAEPHQASDDSGDCAYCSASGLNTNGLTYTLSNGEYTVIKYEMSLGAYDVYIPAEHDGYPVSAIGTEDGSKSSDSICASGSKSNYLEFISIPDSVKTIHPYAFSSCLSLLMVNIPESVSTIGNDAFDGDNKLTLVTGNPTSLTSIGEKAFNNCYALKEMIIPSGVTSLSDSAFLNCFSLKTLTIEEGVMHLGDSAFENCYSLENVYLPSSLRSIGNQTFKLCSSLKNIDLPDGVETVGDSLFSTCYSLEEVSLPSTLIAISENMFNSCYSLKTVYIADGVEEIGSQGFYNCHSLSNINLPESIRAIGDQAFYYCNSLTSIEIPGSVGEISSYAFHYCYSLKDITLNEGLATIDYGAFMYCGMKSITIPYSVKTIQDYAFSSCMNLQTINILGRLRYIGTYAFSNDAGLNLVELPEGVYTIYSNAFDSSSLTSIVIPSSLIVVANNAFAGCYLLKNVFYNGTPEQWEKLINDSFNFGYGNDCLLNARVYYYDDSGTIESAWHYVNDVPTAW